MSSRRLQLAFLTVVLLLALGAPGIAAGGGFGVRVAAGRVSVRFPAGYARPTTRLQRVGEPEARRPLRLYQSTGAQGACTLVSTPLGEGLTAEQQNSALDAARNEFLYQVRARVTSEDVLTGSAGPGRSVRFRWRRGKASGVGQVELRVVAGYLVELIWLGESNTALASAPVRAYFDSLRVSAGP